MSRPHPPSVDRVLAAAGNRLDGRDQAARVAMVRAVLDEERARLRLGGRSLPIDALADEAVARLGALVGVPAVESGDKPSAGEASADHEGASTSLVNVINATGVLLHTNLGRARWPEAAVRAAVAATGATLLELDRDSGRRGKRFRAAEEHVIALAGAEDALIVNNNAAAFALAVGLARRGGVAVSRGELVEIGGGVRIPELIRRAGVRLIEVGTTNRTRLEDFEAVLEEGRAGLVLRVHPSNFVQVGFVEAPEPGALAALAHRHGAILVDDLGSGALLDTAPFGLAHEPMPRERLGLGADVVTFSGDKLVGGPQAGILAGRTDLIARLRKDPFARAMRPDKVTLAALAATLGLYRAGLAAREIPVWRQIATPVEALEERGRQVIEGLGPDLQPAVTLVPSESTVGGGSLPGQVLPSVALRLEAGSPDSLLKALRQGSPPVIGRIDGDRVLLDLRTVEPGEDAVLAAILARVLTGRA